MAGRPLRLPHAGRQAPASRHRRAVAGHRHRRQLRHLQLRRRAAAAAASGRAPGRGAHRRLDARRSKRSTPARWSSSYRDYVDIRDRSKSFDGLAAFIYLTAGFATDPTAHAEAEDGHAGQRQPAPADGRRADHRPRRSDPTRIRCRAATPSSSSAGRCGSRSSAPTRACSAARVRINGIRFTVIGVTPAAFTGMDQFVRSDFFVPLMMSPRLIADPKAGSLEARDVRNLTLKGRLKPGVSQAQAQAELTDDRRRSRARLSRRRTRTGGLVVRTELQARIAQDRAGRDAGRDALDARARRAVRRVRERRRPADQPRAGARARDGAAPRHRRRPRPAHPPAGDREPAAGHRRRRRSGSASATPA